MYRQHFGSLANLTHERLIVIGVRTGEVVGTAVWEGTVLGVRVTPLEILNHPELRGAEALWMAHNHPSGHLEYSRADIVLTARTASLARRLGCRVAGHTIVTRDGMRDIPQELWDAAVDV